MVNQQNQTVLDDELEIDILELLGVLFSKIVLIISITILGALIGFGYSKFVMTPTYDSTTKIYILNRQDGANVTYSDVQLGTQLTKDYKQLITSRYVIEEVIQKLGLKHDYSSLLKKVEVTTPTDTRIVAITVRDYDPVMAMNIANCIREVAATHIQNVMDIDAVNVVETANMPTKKSGPKVSKWMLIGAAAGCIPLCLFIVLRYLLDDTIKTSDDVEKYLGLSTLAMIPKMEDEDTDSKKKKKSSK